MISFRRFVVAAALMAAAVSATRGGEERDARRSLQNKDQADDQSQSSSIEFEACSFEESYTLLGDCGDQSYWVPLSQYSSCISSFRLDPNNATQYLESLISVTKDFYVFNDIAVDPMMSDPLTTPLGYPIYNQKVDVVTEMETLLASVKEEGATWNLFQEVQDIYSKLLDGHMEINQGITSNDINSNGQFAYLAPMEKLSGEADLVEFSVAYPTEDGEFILMANIARTNGVNETKQIAMIGDMEPLDFFVEISSLTPFYSAFKSLGPRVQNLIKAVTKKGDMFPTLYSDADLAKIFQDDYDISYADGTVSKWFILKQVPCVVSDGNTTEEIENLLAQPGSLYSKYQNSSKIVSSLYEQNQPGAVVVPQKRDRRLQESPEDTVGFTMYNWTNDEEGIDGAIAVAVFDDYAVLKVDTGFEYGPELMYDAWNQLSSESATKNVTKLIIDIIGNGGGIITLGYQLAQLMYPNATWEDYASPYDVIWTPTVDLYVKYVKPLVDDIGGSDGDFQNFTDQLNSSPDALTLKLNEFRESLLALELVVPGFESAINTTMYIIQNVEERSPPNILEVEVQMILNQLVELFQKESPLPTGMFDEYGDGEFFPVEHVRGGKTGNYTNTLYKIDPNSFIQQQKKIQQLDNPSQFEQYLILADGNGVGSTSNIFQTTTTLYAKSNAGSVAPTHTVSYGGSGKKQDAAVTQFAGGAVGDADLRPMYIPFFVLFVLHIFTPEIDMINDVLVKYDETVPDPCYYCNKNPRLPVQEIYSVLVGTDSIPMEYVDQTPDYYIKQWPEETSLKDGGDLVNLYEQTSAFFVDCPEYLPQCNAASSASRYSMGHAASNAAFFLACLFLPLSL